jgi:hypothetical protein
MVSANDYIGRRVDLLALHPRDLEATNTPQAVALALALPGTGGTITAGLQKLAQRVFLELLQDVGSEPYFPDRGTSYLTELRSGAVRTSASLLATFTRAAQRATRNLVNEELDTDPTDERLALIRPLNVLYTGDSAGVTFSVVSQAGDSAVYLLPANFSISAV